MRFPWQINKQLRISWAAAGLAGKVRQNNEDNLFVNGLFMRPEQMDAGVFEEGICEEDAQLYAVCDGMGGTEGGEEASRCAVEEISRRRDEILAAAGPDRVATLIGEISERVWDTAQERSLHFGTTLAMVRIRGGDILAANVGDSRIYLMRRGRLRQISTDHSKVQRLVSMGLMTAEQARTDPARHIITQYLGMHEEGNVSPALRFGPGIRREDLILLCSDGLTDMVRDEEIEEILRRRCPPGEMVRELMDKAMAYGGRDNVTVIVLKACDDY